MIPFNQPSFSGKELEYLAQAVSSGHVSGNGPFTKRAESIISGLHGGASTLLTTSCTHALEISARLLDLRPQDEVIVPAFTFVSTASCFMWNCATPVFADVRTDTLNIDPASVEQLISERTRAICIVHYAGVGADPDAFRTLASKHGLQLIEDNAHGLGGHFADGPLGTFGSMSTLSFHETKNITCGEGGALILNDPELVERAEILREKGTDRTKFMRGQVDKYTWVDVGSSWIPSDLLAAVLVAQLVRLPDIQARRVAIWDRYRDGLQDWAAEQGVKLPTVPVEADHPGHLFYLRLPSAQGRDGLIAHLRDRGVSSVFHYQPLHLSPVGTRLGGRPGQCPSAEAAADQLVRLPLFESLSESDQGIVIDAVRAYRFEK